MYKSSCESEANTEGWLDGGQGLENMVQPTGEKTNGSEILYSLK